MRLNVFFVLLVPREARLLLLLLLKTSMASTSIMLRQSIVTTLSIKLTPDYIVWNVFRKRSFKWEVKLIWVCYSRSGVGETGWSNSMFQLEQNPCTVWLNLLTGDSTPSGSVLYWNFFNLKWHPFARKD
jgi:hypothetical protein